MPAHTVAQQVQEAIDNLINHGIILPQYMAKLEDRLSILCLDSKVPPAQNGKYSRSEITKQFKRNNARRVYRSVMTSDPALTLPFLLAAAPLTCRKIDVTKLRTEVARQGQIQLRDSTESVILEIGTRRHLTEQPVFQEFLHTLFPKDLSEEQLPSTTAESNGYTYACANVDAIPTLLANPRYNGLRLRGTNSFKDASFSDSVRMRIPANCYQDAVISLDVEGAIELARTLFPKTRGTLFPTAPVANSSSSHEAPVREIDCGYFTLLGALLASVLEVFGPIVENAVEESELRSWERKHFLLHTTDCCTMTIDRAVPDHGTVHLRIGFHPAMSIIGRLYN